MNELLNVVLVSEIGRRGQADALAEQIPRLLQDRTSEDACTTSLADACGQDDHGDTVPLQASLERIGGLVVEQRTVPGLSLKDELPGKDDGLGKIAIDDSAKLLQLIDDIRADGHVARRR